MSDPIDFDSWLGLVFDDVSGDRVTAHLELAPQHMQPYGLLHGGVYCSIVETLASVGAATWAMDQGMVGVVGVHNATDFLRSAREGTIAGEATPIHRGRTQQLWQVSIVVAGADRVLARGQVRLQNLADSDAIGGITRAVPLGV
ncbi:MAG TPA: PaaI family thioesterase [Acidimicrobiia bacterium]|nr:PaaI family thioesterase [Acidimicrobiia bacterium]